MKIAVVGATGLVGRMMLNVLYEYGIAQDAEIIVAASPRSVGQTMRACGAPFPIVSVDDAIAARPDYALFSAGSEVSLLYAPRFAEQGCTVIDNSSAWRMDPEVPLVIPEVNMRAVLPSHRIIANPNCSTIQMLVALAPLHRAFGLKRVVVSTYQSVSGSGQKGLSQLAREEDYFVVQQGIIMPDISDSLLATSPYPHFIHRNVLPMAGSFEGDDGYTSEELKLVRETHKIFADDSIAVSATAARVPVSGGHSESINAQFHGACTAAEARVILASTMGIELQDNPCADFYPMALFANGSNDVFVGRVRDDLSQPNTINMWVVADNLRKGAATNAVQILLSLINSNR